MSKRNVIIIIAALVVLLIATVVITGGKNKKSAPSNAGSVSTIDKDTGETIVTDKNRTPELQGSGLASLYGGNKLYNIMSQAQFNLLRQSMTAFALSSVGPKVDIIKILPSSIVISETMIDFTAKTVNPEKLIDVKAYLYNGQSIKLVYFDSATKEQLFDSGYLPNDPTDAPTGD